MIARLLLLFALAGSGDAAVSPQVSWVFHAGGSKHDKLRALTVDHHGHTFVTGEFSDAVDLGGRQIRSRGALDFLLAKLDARGRLVWAVTVGGEKIERGYAVAVDNQGGIYVTGHFQSDTLTFGSTVLTNRGDYDAFVARFDAAGRPVWARRAGGEAYDFGHGLAALPGGGIVVSGTVRGGGDFAGEASAPDGVGPFVASYSESGRLRRVWQMTGKGSGSGHELCVDGGGNVFLGGYLAGTGRLGKHTIRTTRGRDLYAARLNAAGTWDWLIQGGGASDGLVSGMAADGDGGCFISGMFKATLRLGDRSHASAGNHDFYLARLGGGGKPQWSVHAGGPAVDYGLGLAVDARGNALLTGETTGAVSLAGHEFKQIGKRDLYAAKFAADGKLLWLWQAGGNLNSLSYAAGCGPDGLNVIAGAFSGDINVAGRSLESRGSNDMLVIGLRD